MIAALFGASRAFFAPANTALGPMLVPRKLLPRAIAWNSLAWQTASIGGPAAAGFLVAVSAQTAYFTTFGLYLVAAILVLSIRKNAKPETNPGSRWELVKEGLAYVWRQKIVRLGADACRVERGMFQQPNEFVRLARSDRPEICVV